MLRFPMLIVCLFMLSAATTAWAGPPPVTASSESIPPGQAVTLRWNFTGKKVIAIGGRFGKGVNVTKQKTVTDRPKKTTRYTFVVYYEGLAPTPAGKVVRKPLQARYNI